jgi:hypothetical protein
VEVPPTVAGSATHELDDTDVLYDTDELDETDDLHEIGDGATIDEVEEAADTEQDGGLDV